ncbi:DUF3037 domain-containing protein [Paenibacillus donghaensis]|uniref:DUF3037 domain-containing protein n=1 Tax=Paenibacillus donghaensis TaxID=414771 RepID=A0A2Z2KCV6_9BACL|nr:DUF3037 domain-containing protein [Paenibacillus donghaensis]ASA19809.1 hypothetical protein B9T62_02685 [Paenibacillus donghaensis]
MERKAYWYSVVQYCPSDLRGETINVGLMLHSPEENALFHSILDESSPKIRGLLQDEVAFKTFKVQKDIFDYFINSVMSSPSLFTPNINDKNFLLQIQENLPSQFKFSEPTFSLTRDPKQLFETLTKTYIGELPSKDIIVEEIVSRNVKQYTKEVFNQKKWIGTKIKPNVKIHPIKDISNMHFTVDYVFKNGVWNLIQTFPSNSTPDKLTEWFSKTNTMLDNYKQDSGFFLIYDLNDHLNKDRTIDDMVHFFEKKDNRISPVAIESEAFNKLCLKVETEAKDITLYESELIAM